MSTLVNVPRKEGLVRKNPLSNFPNLSVFDDLFENSLPSIFTSNFNTGMTLPKVNIREIADAYFVDMAVPGMKKSDFQIDLDNQILSISSEIKDESESKEENYTRKEYGYASFKRTFTLPDSVDHGKIKATYKEGILSIKLPKKEEAKQKPMRTIEIS